MEITLHQETLSYYAPVFSACHSQESTAESVVPDRMPDVSRLLDTDAAVYLRRRSVGQGQITLEAEIHATVLFQGEEDKAVQKLDFELPCSFSIPAEGAREEDRLRLRLSISRADARIINPRKIGLSVETRAVAELFRPATASLTTGADSDALETLVREETVVYAAQIGEKSFTVIEECTMAPGQPPLGEILFARADAAVTEQKTVGGRCILQGNACWELRYLDPEGNPAQSQFTLPFSQLIDIPEETEIGVDVVLTAESAYAEMIPSTGGADSVSLEMHLLAQTVSWVSKKLTLLADAYSVRAECDTETEKLCLSAPVERITLRGNVDSVLELPEPVASVLWSYALPGIPEATEDAVTLPIRIHALCRKEDGELCSVSRSVSASIPSAEDASDLQFGAPICRESYLSPKGERLELRMEAELPAVRIKESVFAYVSGAKLGEETVAEESAPSLIVLRSTGEDLWELAKRCHSTLSLIHAANGEKAGDLLLIPRAR